MLKDLYTAIFKKRNRQFLGFVSRFQKKLTFPWLCEELQASSPVITVALVYNLIISHTKPVYKCFLANNFFRANAQKNTCIFGYVAQF